MVPIDSSRPSRAACASVALAQAPDDQRARLAEAKAQSESAAARSADLERQAAADRHRAGAIVRGAVTQLAIGIPAPAERVAARGQAEPREAGPARRHAAEREPEREQHARRADPADGGAEPNREGHGEADGQADEQVVHGGSVRVLEAGWIHGAAGARQGEMALPGLEPGWG